MITLIITLVAISIMIFMWKNSPYDKFGAVMGSFLVAGIFSVVISLISTGIPMQEISRVDQSCPIYSLNNSDKTSGEFALGSGSIGQTEYYRTFYKTERNSYVGWEVPVDNAELILDDNQPPQVKWQKVTSKFPWWFCFWKITRETDTKYDIVCPQNTILQKFEVK